MKLELLRIVSFMSPFMVLEKWEKKEESLIKN